MKRFERKTEIRGNVAHPEILERIRRLRWRRFADLFLSVLAVIIIAPYFLDVLPALRRIVSSEYLTPLPLYGSGGRNERISAAICPICCLSAPLMLITFFSTAIVTPAGIS